MTVTHLRLPGIVAVTTLQVFVDDVVTFGDILFLELEKDGD